MEGQIDFRTKPVEDYPPGWQSHPKYRHGCYSQMWISSIVANCPRSWEPLVRLCWPPARSGYSVKIPCPDDGYLNADEYVYRFCSDQGKWLVRKHLNRSKAFSDFVDCLKPRQIDPDEQLRRHANAQTVMILKTLYEHRLAYLSLNCVSFTLNCVALAFCFSHRRRSHTEIQRFKYNVFIVALFALVVNQITTLTTKMFYDDSYTIQCRIAKTIDSFTNIVFSECLFACVFAYCAYIMNYQLKRNLLRFLLFIILLVAGCLVTLQGVLEVTAFKGTNCGFGMNQSSYPWVITGPTLFIIANTFCLDADVLYAVFVLKLKQIQQLRSLQVASVCILVVAIVNCACEILLIMVHHSASEKYEESTIQMLAHSFAALSATRGIVFSILMCYLDSETCACLKCDSSQSYLPTEPRPKQEAKKKEEEERFQEIEI